MQRLRHHLIYPTDGIFQSLLRKYQKLNYSNFVVMFMALTEYPIHHTHTTIGSDYTIVVWLFWVSPS